MPLIALQDVHKVYQMGTEEVRALDGVSLTVDEGEFLSIIGPSGSGKSTLMHILGFMDRPSSGTIHFEGRDVSSLSATGQAAIRSSKIGFIFQSFNLLPRMSVLENVLLPYSYYRGPRRDAKKNALAALDHVGMSHRIKHRPTQLSGGERQRVAIARALANQPRLILADEPTGNLDSKNAENVMALFENLSRAGHTLALVTHDPNVAAHAPRQIRVLDGKVREEVTA